MTQQGLTRRQFGVLAGGVFASAALGACNVSLPAAETEGRLKARPVAGVKTTAQGTAALGLGSSRDALLQMPSNPATGPVPLMRARSCPDPVIRLTRPRSLRKTS